MESQKEFRFTVENLNSLISQNNSSMVICFFEKQFERPDLISKTRYRDNSNFPWGAWNEVAELTNSFFRKSKKIYDLRGLSQSFSLNLSYFAPDVFFFQPEAAFEFISSLKYASLCIVLSRKGNAKRLVDYLKYNDKDLKINPLLAIQIALAAVAHELLDKAEEEIFVNKIIVWLDYSYGQQSDLAKKALTARLRALNNVESPLNEENEIQSIALLVCGQLRGFQKTMPKLQDFFGIKTKVDIFVSTWTNPGLTRITWPNLRRVLTNEAADWLIHNHPDLDLSPLDRNIRHLIKGSQEHNPQGKLASIFSWANSFALSNKDEEEYPYNRMSNPEKMYYHNAYWIETLGKNHFLDYDLVIKIRPDLMLDKTLEKFNDIKLESGVVFCEGGGWIYREWGFGMGDQIIFGRPKDMLEILSCHRHDDLSTKIVRDIFSLSPFYKGHVNCGVANWLSGNTSKPSPIRTLGLADTDKLSTELLKEALKGMLK